MSRRPAKLSLGTGPWTRGSGLEESAEGGVSLLPYNTAIRSFEQQLDSHFDGMAKLGSGSTSTVSRAVWKTDLSIVAVKVTRCSDSDMTLHAQKEYELLRKLSYPTIPCVRHFEAYADFGRAVMVMSYFEGSELQRAVTSAAAGRLEELVVLEVARQLMSTLDYLHCHGVLHRDIKPQNVLVSDSLERICLIDFNASHCQSAGEPLTPTGTRLYAAPEVVRGDGASAASDVWGAGLCLYFALCGHLPQGRRPSSSDTFLLQGQCTREVAFPSKWWAGISEPCKSCLQKSLAVQELHRAAAAELLRVDPWLAMQASD